MSVVRLFTDGAARGNPGKAGAGVVIEDDQGMRLAGCHRWLGHKTNNQAEYLALIDGLKEVAKWHPEMLEVYLDSLLVVQQVRGKYRVKDAGLKPLYEEAMGLYGAFPVRNISHVDREKNHGADALANRAIDEHDGKTAAAG